MDEKEIMEQAIRDLECDLAATDYKYDMVKDYYDRRLWSKQRVYNAVGKWITSEQYEEITGEAYEGSVK